MIDIQLENGAWVQAEVCAYDLLPEMVKRSDKGDYWIIESWIVDGVRSGTVIHVLDPVKSIVEVLEMKGRSTSDD